MNHYTFYFPPYLTKERLPAEYHLLRRLEGRIWREHQSYHEHPEGPRLWHNGRQTSLVVVYPDEDTLRWVCSTPVRAVLIRVLIWLRLQILFTHYGDPLWEMSSNPYDYPERADNLRYREYLNWMGAGKDPQAILRLRSYLRLVDLAARQYRIARRLDLE